jgi:hypothetical protein
MLKKEILTRIHWITCARNIICKTIGWSDPTDCFYVHAFIATQALLEQKRRREEGGEGPSKRFNKGEKGWPQTNPQHEELNVEVPSTWASTSIKNKENECLKDKSKGPTYKLRFDIKAAINFKKVLNWSNTSRGHILSYPIQESEHPNFE